MKNPRKLVKSRENFMKFSPGDENFQEWMKIFDRV
jgi:hypothetical protein